jgi:hypothetical protein
MELLDAYTAGLIDGEGSITLPKYKEFRYPMVSVSSTTYGLVSFLKKRYGGCISQKKKKAKSHHKTGYAWAVQRDAALEVLTKVSEYLREPEKKRRAKLILRYYKNLTPRNGKYTEQMRTAKQKFEKKFFSTTTHVNTAL